MRAFRMGRDLAERHAMQPGGDLDPVLRSLGLEVGRGASAVVCAR